MNRFLYFIGSFFLPFFAFSQCDSLTMNVIAAVDPDCGVANGTIVVYAQGNHPPFTYSWEDGQTGTVAIGLYAGFYRVHITDSAGCTMSGQVLLENPTFGPNADLVVTNVSCFGQANGAVSIQNITHYPPYHYTWDNGSTTAQIDNLTAGMYNVLAFDSSDCATFLTGIVTQPDSFYLEITPNAATAMATVTAIGGTPPYHYQWSNGDTTNIADSLAPNQVYVVSVTDAHQCKTSQNISISSLSPNNDLLQNIEIYPNPFSQTITLNTSLPYTNLALYDVYGKEIWQEKLTTPTQTLDFSYLPNQIYFLRCEYLQNATYIKIWKQ